MTTSREVVPNTPLSGAELKTIIRQDFDRLLSEDGMLGDYLAFGRAAYRITIELQMDNPLSPSTSTSRASQAAAQNSTPSPTRKAVESFPLTPLSTDAKIVEGRTQRRVTSPNKERLLSGQPVPVQRKQNDGTTITEMVKYPPDERIGEGDVETEVKEIE
jgi:hypothetical protein